MTAVFEFKAEAQPYLFAPGVYKVELWGGQGGNASDTAYGGKGGYASGIIQFRRSKTLYFFIGEKGIEGEEDGFTRNAFNGGGCGNKGEAGSVASGAGSTDLRTDVDISSRILVASGGSGACLYRSLVNDGVCGGDLFGVDGKNSVYDGQTYEKGYGATQISGGSSPRQEGKFLFGGNQTEISKYGSGGGGGWFGGGSGYGFGATGGSGSGYASGLFMKSEIISGCSEFPSFYDGKKTIGHVGNGAAKVTFLGNHICSNEKSNTKIQSVLVFVLLL